MVLRMFKHCSHDSARSASVLFSLSSVSSLSNQFRPFVAVLMLGVLLSNGLVRTALAQGSKRASTYDLVEEKDKDRPDLRDRWMMRGRSAPHGRSAAALRLRAHQQKLAMRAGTKDVQAATPDNGTGIPWV